MSGKQLGLAQKTYLNRDHNGQMSSNYLSHGILLDEKELNFYPAEIYGSGMWYSRMDDDAISSPETPQLLPAPKIIKGQRVSVQGVMDFLAENRIGLYKKMLAAMFLYKSTKKKIIICDSFENIIMWIAALHYALPLEIAKDISFATYEYDPARSHYQICGAASTGTAYNPNGAHFIFDFTRGIFPDIDTSDIFFSMESYQAFHEFIIEKLTYRSADENYLKAFSLYRMLECGLNTLSFRAFRDAMHMANSHAYKSVLAEVHEEIIRNKAFIMSTSDEFALEMLKALPPTKDSTNELIAERVIVNFKSKSATRDSFWDFYKSVKDICTDISPELIKDSNMKTMAAHLTDEQWQWDFLVEICCDYVISHNISVENLSLDYKMGRLIGDIVAARINKNPNLGFVLVTRIIARFAHDWSYLANMAFNLEGVILDAPESEAICNKHWAYVYDMIVSHQSQSRQHVYKLFFSLDRSDQVFELYSVFMNRAANSKVARELFFEQLKIEDKGYIQDYHIGIYEHYYNFLATQNDSTAKRELVRFIADNNITADFVPGLIDMILTEIPIGSLSKDNEKMVNILLDYCRECLPERLILLASGMLIVKASSAFELVNTMNTIKNIAKADVISGVDSKYVNWVAPHMFGCSKSPEELEKCYRLYKHTTETTKDFITVWCKESTRGRELIGMIMFLGFLFAVGDASNRNDTGKIFGKLNKQRLEALNEAVLQKYNGDVKHLFYWSEVYDAAASSSSVFSGISNLFRRKV